MRYDLVWRLPDGRVWADEIKTGRPPGVLEGLEEQVNTQVAAGVQEWGPTFLGVRVVLLAAPAQSYYVFPDGEREPVQFGDDEGADAGGAAVDGEVDGVSGPAAAEVDGESIGERRGENS